MAPIRTLLQKRDSSYQKYYLTKMAPNMSDTQRKWHLTKMVSQLAAPVSSCRAHKDLHPQPTPYVQHLHLRRVIFLSTSPPHLLVLLYLISEVLPNPC